MIRGWDPGILDQRWDWGPKNFVWSFVVGGSQRDITVKWFFKVSGQLNRDWMITRFAVIAILSSYQSEMRLLIGEIPVREGVQGWFSCSSDMQIQALGVILLNQWSFSQGIDNWTMGHVCIGHLYGFCCFWVRCCFSFDFSKGFLGFLVYNRSGIRLSSFNKTCFQYLHTSTQVVVDAISAGFKLSLFVCFLIHFKLMRGCLLFGIWPYNIDGQELIIDVRLWLMVSLFLKFYDWNIRCFSLNWFQGNCSALSCFSWSLKLLFYPITRLLYVVWFSSFCKIDLSRLYMVSGIFLEDHPPFRCHFGLCISNPLVMWNLHRGSREKCAAMVLRWFFNFYPFCIISLWFVVPEFIWNRSAMERYDDILRLLALTMTRSQTTIKVLSVKIQERKWLHWYFGYGYDFGDGQVLFWNVPVSLASWFVGRMKQVFKCIHGLLNVFVYSRLFFSYIFGVLLWDYDSQGSFYDNMKLKSVL
ncbi:unnamed protein product [Eruca vesicaria subsp. sativa]|uniref:Uncharacterized protein n=1 Tax=Eruca vesicaria subsp. sativa TaxID=29727 RepID=A0ABC8M696_ERUVS|nr:unnamed protein product [Eruca vesicaria subsp. sativa]